MEKFHHDFLLVDMAEFHHVFFRASFSLQKLYSHFSLQVNHTPFLVSCAKGIAILEISVVPYETQETLNLCNHLRLFPLTYHLYLGWIHYHVFLSDDVTQKCHLL